MYKVIALFKDLKDSGYLYNVGDLYPRKGYTPEPGRIEELSSPSNKRGTPLIVEVKEEAKPKTEPKAEPKTEEVNEVKPKKKATKKAKKK